MKKLISRRNFLKVCALAGTSCATSSPCAAFSLTSVLLMS